MVTALIAITIGLSIALGWSIGANDAANSLGTAVGSRVITLRQGIVLITVFGLLGACLQGGHVVKTIGKGIVDLTALEPRDATGVAFVATLASCLWVVLATYFKMPVSTSHSIVGAVAGAGLAIRAPVHWAVLRDVFICWVLTPAGAALLGYVFLRVLTVLFKRFVPAALSPRLLAGLIIASGCYVAYTWGANDVANATGLITGAGILPPFTSVALGGLAIVLGIVTWGYKVIETIGSRITYLLPIMAFAAQLASGVNVHIYTMLGVPVSTSHSIVGAIFGVGLVRGMKMMNVRVLREIVACWVATPFISGAMSFVLLKVAAIWYRG